MVRVVVTVADAFVVTVADAFVVTVVGALVGITVVGTGVLGTSAGDGVTSGAVVCVVVRVGRAVIRVSGVGEGVVFDD